MLAIITIPGNYFAACLTLVFCFGLLAGAVANAPTDNHNEYDDQDENDYSNR